MAKREIVLTDEQWKEVVRLVGIASVGSSTSEQAKRMGLLSILEAKATQEEGPRRMTRGQCRAVIDALETPGIPYVSAGLSRLWELKEAFGWTRPDLDLYMDDDEDDD
jgi:hypothetical protein